MARWLLKDKHYLNVPGTEWEQKEVNMVTGKQGRKVYVVPMYLNPDEPSDQNYKELGQIIVCHEGKGLPRDIVFEGDPTNDMEPLDDEAAKLSQEAATRRAGEHPIESLATFDVPPPATRGSVARRV